MKRVIVIGGGPAGLAAAASALAKGGSVVLLEANRTLGGQFWRHPPQARTDVDPKFLQHNWRTFRRLSDAVTSDSRCAIIREAEVWAINSDDHRPLVHAAVGDADGPDRKMIKVTGDALVIATGAHDLTLPFPGWDLPGVYTGGAAQAMAKTERVPIGKRVVVAGAGPFLLPVAESLLRTGAEVVGVYEAAGLRTISAGWLPSSPWLAPLPGKITELFGYAAGQIRNRVPYLTGRAVIRAHGEDAVAGVTVSRIDDQWRPVPGSQEFVEADAVCVTHGFTPRLELAIAAGCGISADRFVIVDRHLRTTVPGVFAAGESTGIGGVEAALAEGKIAGHLAAGGRLTDAALRRTLLLRRSLDRLAGSIQAAHGVRSGWTSWLTDDTVICRCEGVSYGRIRAVTGNTESRSLRSLKLSTRAGLGPCQGRICGRTVERLITSDGRGPFLDGASTDRRPIAVPIRLSELAATEQDPTEESTR
jgi:NADPH-dependent 2,4-dienoyl-CoA reductase/sulfur reductase-like enzyme